MSCVYITANAQIPVIMIFIKLNLTIYLMWLTQKNRLHSCVWWDARGLLFWRGWTGFVCVCVKGADIGSLCRALSSVDHRYGSPEGWFTDAGKPTSSYFTNLSYTSLKIPNQHNSSKHSQSWVMHQTSRSLSYKPARICPESTQSSVEVVCIHFIASFWK